MATDILNSILDIIIPIIILVVGVYILITLINALFKLLDYLLGKAVWYIDTSLKALGVVFSISILVTVMFTLYVTAAYIGIPNNMIFELNSNNHDFKIGSPFIPVSGTYEETDDGYMIYPNFGLPFPFLPGLPIQQLDKKHIHLMYFFNFVPDGKILKHPSLKKGILSFVPG